MSCFFDPDLMGSLPDVRVPDCSVEDWQAVLDLVEARGWKCQYSQGETVLPLPRAETVLPRPADAECPNLRVWPTPFVLAIFRFLDDEVIDFDVDLRELQGHSANGEFVAIAVAFRPSRSVKIWNSSLEPLRSRLRQPNSSRHKRSTLL